MSRIFTDEELKNLGTLTIDKIKTAADKGDAEAVKSLADEMYRQLAYLHDGYMCWVSGLQSWIYDNHGVDSLEAAERFAHAFEAKVAFLPVTGLSFKEEVERRCDILKGHVFAGIEVSEDDEKVIVAVDPCGSGGRLIEMDAYSKGAAVIKEKCPASWGRGELPVYCCHCPIMEGMNLDNGGDLKSFHPTSPRLSEKGRCEYHMYKDLKNIPEEYYARLGRKRPGAE